MTETPDEKNEFRKALVQLPEFIKTAQMQSQQIDHLSQMVAQVIQRQMTATIPEEEHQKMAETISRTPCAAPDMSEVAGSLSKAVMRDIRLDIHDEAVSAVKEAVKDTPVKVEHTHLHTSMWDYAQRAEKKVRGAMVALGIWSVLATLLIVFGVWKYFNSDVYVGKQFEEVYRSPYTTDEERKMLGDDLYYYGIVPEEFHKSPALVKAKIKRNKEILSQRKAEKASKGKFSTKVPLER